MFLNMPRDEVWFLPNNEKPKSLGKRFFIVERNIKFTFIAFLIFWNNKSRETGREVEVKYIFSFGHCVGG